MTQHLKTTVVRRGLALLLCLLLTFNLGGITALAEGETVTIYFVDKLGWNCANIQYDGNDAMLQYPGAPMEAAGVSVSGETIYRYTVPVNVDHIGFLNPETYEQSDMIDFTESAVGVEDGDAWYLTEEMGELGHIAARYEWPVAPSTLPPDGGAWYPGNYRITEDTTVNGDLRTIFDDSTSNEFVLSIDEGVTLTVTGKIGGSTSSTTGNRLTVVGGGTLVCSSIGGYMGLTVGNGEDSPTVEVNDYISLSEHYLSYLKSGTVLVAGRIGANLHLCGGSLQVGSSYTDTDIKIDDGWIYTDGTGTLYDPGTISAEQAADFAGMLLHPVVSHSVTVFNDGTGCTITADRESALEGEPVTLSAELDPGWLFGGFLVLNDETGDYLPVDEYGQFTMPDASVTVTATFTSEWYELNQQLEGASTDSAAPTLITLDRDYTASPDDNPLVIRSGRYVTLDLNGHTLDRHMSSKTADGNVITVGGNLTVKDSTGGGKITGGNNKGYGGGVSIAEAGALTLIGVSIRDNNADYGAGVSIAQNGTFTMTGGSICNNGTIFDDDGNGCYKGGGVYIKGTFTMTGGSISDNSATYGGGVEIATTGASFTMNDGTISGNECSYRGGGVEIGYGGMFTMNDGTVTGNTCTGISSTSQGGGITCMNNSTFKVSGAARVTDNHLGTAVNNVYLYGDRKITLDGALTADASIGVNMANNTSVFTSGLSGNGAAACFFSDSNSFRVRANANGEAELAKLSTVTVNGGAGGGDYAEGESVTITANEPETGMQFEVWSGADGLIFSEGNAYTSAATFDMPASDVTVTATYGATDYRIYTAITGSGDVSAYVNGSFANAVHYNDAVVLDVDPADGYVIGAVSYNDGSDHVLEPVDGVCSFVMPASDVTVSVTFLRDMSYDMYVYLDDIPTYEETARFPYTGDPIEPAVRVEDYLNDDEELTPGTDYEVSYSDNTGSPDAVTEATVTITGIGAYTGSKTVTFRIIPDGLDIANCELKGTLEAYYDADQYQAVAVAGLEVWYGEIMLERDVDYYVEVEWVEEYEVGETYSATITGEGDWTGEITCEVELIELSHPVVFVANGGSGSMDDDTVTLTNYTVGYTYTLPPCGFDPAYGMKFDHWEVYYEGIEEDPIKQPGEYFTAPFIWNESFVTTVTVTAIWTERAENEKVTLTAAALDHGSLLLNGEPAALTDGALSLFGSGQVTVVPNAGYVIDSVSYNDGSDHSVAPDEDGAYSFTMPEADATLTVTFDYILATAPTIDTQPADLTLTYGYAEGALTVAATGLEGQPLSYQWYACDDADGTNPQAIDGAADASFTVPTGKNAGTTEYYFCVVTATREDNGDSADTTTNAAAVTVEKADLYASEEIPDVTQYVPGDKAGSYSLALPALPEGAAYSFTLADGDGLLDTAPEIDAESVLSFATNSGKDAGTTAVITVTAAGAPNYNDYGFDVNVVVSAYTVEYAWPEQTSIWLDADDQLAWSAEGITLDESRITVMQDGAPVTDFDFAVEGNGEVMEPGPNRVLVTGEGLYDWVDFTVIELIEDDPGFILDIPDWTYPDVARSWHPPVWDEIVGSLTYDGNTVELTKDDISRGDGIDDGSLKLWYENADKPHMSDTVFLTRELTIDDFYYVGGGWDFITPFGSVVDVGNHNVYLPDHVTVKQLLDEAGDPVPAGDNGGTIYYMCDSRPDLHVEQSESEVDGETVTVLTLYNGDTPVQDGYYFRYGDDFYYGNGENAYTSYGGDDGFLSFWPVKSYANGSVYPLGDKPVTQAYDFDENGDPVYVDNSLATGNYNKKLESHYEVRPDYRDTVYVGGNYFYYESMGFLYTGNITPAVSGSTISFGDYQIDLGTGVAIAWLPNDTIDGSGATDVWNCPHAYARYKADDFHYQIADQEFIIYPNNSLITIKNNKDEYHVGDDAEIVIELRQLERGMSVFVNGDLYERFEGYGDHTLTLENLHEGTYTLDVFGDGDDCVTGYTTHTSFTVVPNIITITQEPEDASAPLGETVVVTVAAEGEGLTYQWYYRDAGAEEWITSIYTGDTYTLTMKGTRNGREVYCVVTDAEGNTSATRTATLSIELPEDYVYPAITRDAEDCFVPGGERPSVTVEATGYSELKYQWYYANPGSETWNKSSVKTDTYTCAMSLSRHGRRIYCVVSDAYGSSVQSETVTIGFDIPDGYAGPTITRQPSDSFVDVDGMTDVTVAAEGVGELSYQWYYRDAGTEKWSKSSLLGESYAVYMKIARDGRQVYCEVTDACGFKAVSETATIGYAYPEGYEKPSVTALSGDVTVGPGEMAVTAVGAAGDGELSYQWYYRNAGAEKWSKSIYTGDTYTLSMRANRDGREVYCVVTDRYGAKAESEPVTLRMTVTEGYTGPAILTEPQNASAPEGQAAVVTVAAEGEELTYQWYYRNAGAEKWSKSIYTGDTYTLNMTAARDGREVYCVVTDRYGYTVTSQVATLTLEP